MSSNGRAWHTNAQGAADYLFNPVFMTFFILCVILYATLMQPSEETALPVPAQMVLWGGLIMTSLIWIFFGVWASVVAHDRGLTKAIYTPVILIPLVFVNVFMGEFVLSIYNEDFQGSYGSMLENFAQNSIIMIVFDIMHARFVAPQHPKYVDKRSAAEQTVGPSSWATDPSVSVPSNTAQTSAGTLSTEPSGMHLGLGQPGAGEAKSDPAGPGCPPDIEIAREKIDPSSIVWIKSEDHYLSFQMKDRNHMLRGKLRTVVDQLGDSLGSQINRSVWVAYDAIRAVEERSAGGLEVHMVDETVFRVSSSRRLVFLQNYERFKTSGEGRLAG